MVDKYQLTIILKEDEGYRQFPYHDTEGVLTIGIGRNLRDKGISEEEAEYLLGNDIAEAETGCEREFAFWYALPVEAQLVLICLAFNMGLNGLLTFEKMITHLSRAEYQSAADELENSRWAHQVGLMRRERMVQMLRNCA
jgi:lysozyme